MTASRAKKRRQKEHRVSVTRDPGVVTAQPAPSPRKERALAVVVAVAVAGLVRLEATRNDLWLDEIWTLKLLGEFPCLFGVFTLRHDNNHILNSLFVYTVSRSSSRRTLSSG